MDKKEPYKKELFARIAQAKARLAGQRQAANRAAVDMLMLDWVNPALRERLAGLRAAIQATQEELADLQRQLQLTIFNGNNDTDNR